MKQLVVILDAAHGIDVPGKRSPDGKHLEYKWSREILESLRVTLLQKGYEVFETAPANLKEPGLSYRAHIANNINRDPAKKLLISLHNNAAGMGTQWMDARGFATYTAKTKPQGWEWADKTSEIYAQLLDDQVRKMTTPGLEKDKMRTPTPQDPCYDENFTVLYMAQCPALLFECLFQDNQQDCEILASQQFKNEITSTLASWIDQCETLIPQQP